MLQEVLEILQGAGAACLLPVIVILIVTLIAILKGMVVLPSTLEKAVADYRDMVADRDFWRERHLAERAISNVATAALVEGQDV